MGAFSLVPVVGVAPINRAMGRLIRHHVEYGQSGRRVQMKKPAGAGRVFRLGNEMPAGCARGALKLGASGQATRADHPTDTRGAWMIWYVNLYCPINR